ADPRLAEIDVSAFLLRADGKVAGDSGMVFYGQRESAGVSLTRIAAAAGAGKETAFAIGFGALPQEIERIAFTATIHDGATAGLTFSRAEALEIVVGDGADAVQFDVPLAGSTETALVLGELYLRNGAWKFRAVAQGFAGGLAPLARSFGVDIAAEAPAPPTPPPAAPPPAPISLSKVTLSKASPSVDLAKKAEGFGEVRVNLNWTRKKPSGGFFGGSKPVDLDVGCLFELADGSKGAVQALGDLFGAFDSRPFIQLAADDRSGASTDGEWMRINGRRWGDIRRVLIYAYIYEGAPNWAATDGVATVYVPGAAPIEVLLEDGGRQGMCAIGLIENTGGEMRIQRKVDYFPGHAEMDKAFGWGLNWVAGSKG
ncbi:MAG: TerD family protein, partial [Hyphomicrobium sp.]|nr:TerD family protein [Hyphomicrobium sp.]